MEEEFGCGARAGAGGWVWGGGEGGEVVMMIMWWFGEVVEFYLRSIRRTSAGKRRRWGVRGDFYVLCFDVL